MQYHSRPLTLLPLDQAVHIGSDTILGRKGACILLFHHTWSSVLMRHYVSRNRNKSFHFQECWLERICNIIIKKHNSDTCSCFYCTCTTNKWLNCLWWLMRAIRIIVQLLIVFLYICKRSCGCRYSRVLIRHILCNFAIGRFIQLIVWILIEIIIMF